MADAQREDPRAVGREPRKTYYAGEVGSGHRHLRRAGVIRLLQNGRVVLDPPPPKKRGER